MPCFGDGASLQETLTTLKGALGCFGKRVRFSTTSIQTIQPVPTCQPKSSCLLKRQIRAREKYCKALKTKEENREQQLNRLKQAACCPTSTSPCKVAPCDPCPSALPPEIAHIFPCKTCDHPQGSCSTCDRPPVPCKSRHHPPVPCQKCDRSPKPCKKRDRSPKRSKKRDKSPKRSKKRSRSPKPCKSHKKSRKPRDCPHDPCPFDLCCDDEEYEIETPNTFKCKLDMVKLTCSSDTCNTGSDCHCNLQDALKFSKKNACDIIPLLQRQGEDEDDDDSSEDEVCCNRSKWGSMFCSKKQKQKRKSRKDTCRPDLGPRYPAPALGGHPGSCSRSCQGSNMGLRPVSLSRSCQGSHSVLRPRPQPKPRVPSRCRTRKIGSHRRSQSRSKSLPKRKRSRSRSSSCSTNCLKLYTSTCERKQTPSRCQFKRLKKTLSKSQLRNISRTYCRVCKKKKRKGKKRRRRKGRRRRYIRRPRPRNLCCRCLVCCALVWTILCCAAFTIPILTGLVPPPP